MNIPALNFFNSTQKISFKGVQNFKSQNPIQESQDVFVRKAEAPKTDKTDRAYQIINEPEKYMDKFLNEDYIQSAFEAHKEEVSKILGKFGYEPKVDMSHIQQVRGHLFGTYNFAKNITTIGEFELSEDERLTLLEAALIHDIGKALIPDEILNKPGRLTPDEKAIMDTHSEIGYVLLKDSGLSDDTLNAIRYHHHKEQTGDDVIELLSISDEVSALKERRPYKKNMRDEQVATILSQDAKAGKINSDLTVNLHNTLYD